MSVLRLFFDWPNGGVWSNLLASAIWTVPALGWHHRAVRRHLDRHHAATNARLDAMEERHP